MCSCNCTCEIVPRPCRGWGKGRPSRLEFSWHLQPFRVISTNTFTGQWAGVKWTNQLLRCLAFIRRTSNGTSIFCNQIESNFEDTFHLDRFLPICQVACYCKDNDLKIFNVFIDIKIWQLVNINIFAYNLI